MGNQVVGLENETDGVVSVRIPVSCLVLLGRFAVDDQITGRVFVQSADDVEHRRLSASGRTQERNEFCVSEGHRNTF